MPRVRLGRRGAEHWAHKGLLSLSGAAQGPFNSLFCQILNALNPAVRHMSAQGSQVALHPPGVWQDFIKQHAPAYLPICPPTCLLTCQPACPTACLPAHLLAHLLACLLALYGAHGGPAGKHEMQGCCVPK